MKFSAGADWQIVGSIQRITFRLELVGSANDMLGARRAALALKGSVLVLGCLALCLATEQGSEQG